MSSSTKVSFPAFTLTISAELYSPKSGSPDRHGATVVVSHPMTGVKEQTSADYARGLSAAGFYALTFDAGYQGESSGEPRGLEDPHQRVEDNKAAVTYLTSLPGKVDPERIGILGICASGGYVSCVAQSDIRIKAVATVSAACVGRMTRCGGLHAEQNKQESPEAIAGALQAAGKWRTEHANKIEQAPEMFSIDINSLPKDVDSFFRDAAEYYGSKRGLHPRSDHRVPLASYDLMVPYDSFNLQHIISPRPLLMIAGSKAQTLHYSQTAIEIAKEPKELFVVKDRNHFDLYDDLEESLPKCVEFFGKYLS